MGKSSSPNLGKNHQIELSSSNNNNNNNNNTNGGKRKRTTNSMDEQQKQGVMVSNEQGQEEEEEQERHRLSDVVSECTKRWFQDTLKEARNGDVNMQIILAQMYYSGYGIPKDPKKGKTWITRASRVRSSAVWKVCRKRPGYNASDSDSDDIPDDDDDDDDS